MTKLESTRKKYHVRIQSVLLCISRNITYLLSLLCACAIEEFKVYYSLIE